MSHQTFLRMHPPVLDWANNGLIALNVFLGAILIDHLNLVAAGVGILVTVFANVGKIASSIAQVNQIRKNGWLPVSNNEEKLPEDEGK